MNDTNAHGEEAFDVSKLPEVPTAKIRTILKFVAAALLIFFLIGWLPRHFQYKQSKADAEATASNVLQVAVVTPKPAQAVGDVSLSGDIQPLQSTQLYPRTSGYLKKMYVDIGDRVEKGQLLAEIDTPEVDASLDQAKAQLNKAQSDLELQSATLRRFQPLKGVGAISQQELDEKQAALKVSQAVIDDARANAQRLAALQGFEKIIAPFAGIVAVRNYDLGALLNAGSTTELFRIDRIDTVRVFINVPQTYVGGIKPQQNASLSVRNYPDRTFTGTVARTSGSLDTSSRTLKVQVNFPNADGALSAGMYGEVNIKIDQNAPITIPTSALLFDAGGMKIATVSKNEKDEQVARLKKVVLGRDFGVDVEVLSGIEKTDQVVANPGQGIGEGSVVNATTVKPAS